MNEQWIMDLNSDPWRLRKMSVKELLDTAALANAMLDDASTHLQAEIRLLVDKCHTLACEEKLRVQID